MADPQQMTLGAAKAKLERQISRTRWSMAIEAALRAFWPAVALAGVGVSAWAFGLLWAVGPPMSLALVVLFGLGLIAALVWGARALDWPSRDAAIMRLDTALPGRPIEALGDTIAVGRDDPAAQALWARHLQIMAERAAAARAARPDLNLAPRDPWALRLVAIAAVVAAAIFAGRPEPIDLAIRTADPTSDVAVGPSFEAWANPPGYTGRPTLYLTADVPTTLDLPTGTEVTIRVYGTEADHAVAETVSGTDTALAQVAEGIGSVSFQVTQDGRFGLSKGGMELAGWDVTVLPDAGPTIALDGEEVTRAVTGAMELSFRATDDYGVVRGETVLELDLDAVDRRYGLALPPDPRRPIVLDLPMPLSGATTEVIDTLVEDLSKHPWAGLPMRVTLIAEDAAGQQGQFEATDIPLPGRRFFDPLARALVEQRRDLLWNIENAPRVDQMLRTITHAPEDIFSNRTAYLMTRMALRRLGYAAEDGLDTAEQEDVAELLWQAALLVEDGVLADARERLRRAQERLSDALKNGATNEEIAELMDELNEAMQDYLRLLAQEMQENPDQLTEQPEGESRLWSQNDLQRMLDEIQRLAENGQQEEAQALLEELQRLLENLQMQAQQGGQSGQQGQGQQMMQELQDTLRQQQDLADESFRELQRQFNEGRQQQGQQNQQQGQQGQQGQQQGQQGQGQQPGQPGRQGQNGQQPGQQQGQNGQPGPTAGQLSQRQEALRRMLDDLRNQLPGPGTEGGANARRQLDEAERQMGDARDSLEQGDLGQALDDQADAMDALREGIRGLGEELQQQAQENQGDAGQQTGGNRAGGDRDPLGRLPNGNDMGDGPRRSMVGEGDLFKRAQELFDEIRRRSGDQNRPAEELDYLRRLLDRF